MGGVTLPLPLRLALVGAAALALAAPTHAVAAGAPTPSPSPQARVHLLARSGHGPAVVAALGDRLPQAAGADPLGARLPQAAATNRMSPTALRAVLENDPTAWVGRDGQLFYVEEAEALTAT